MRRVSLHYRFSQGMPLEVIDKKMRRFSIEILNGYYSERVVGHYGQMIIASEIDLFRICAKIPSHHVIGGYMTAGSVLENQCA